VFNHRLPGQYFDVESGLHYNRYRYYSSSLVRYVTEDPLGIDGLMGFLGGIFSGLNTNLYPYVTNNPLNWIDPYGLNGGWTQTGGQDGNSGAEQTWTCTCDNGDQVATVTRDAWGKDKGNLTNNILDELNKDYNPDLFCGR